VFDTCFTRAHDRISVTRQVSFQASGRGRQHHFPPAIPISMYPHIYGMKLYLTLLQDATSIEVLQSRSVLNRCYFSEWGRSKIFFVVLQGARS